METGCLLHCLEVEETNVFEAVKQSVTTTPYLKEITYVSRKRT